MPTVLRFLSFFNSSSLAYALNSHTNLKLQHLFIQSHLHSTSFLRNMSTPKLASVPEVEIDNGRFKYVLIKVYDKDDKGQEVSKSIVRGYNWAAYHADVYDSVDAKITQLGLESECVGGGRILHDLDQQSIQIYGHSTGFGKADHSITADILKKQYPDYKSITWSDEGY